MAKAAMSDLIKAARREIQRETVRAYDVAADTGQIFDNVAHMTWFIDAVAYDIACNSKKYQHLADQFE